MEPLKNRWGTVRPYTRHSASCRHRSKTDYNSCNCPKWLLRVGVSPRVTFCHRFNPRVESSSGSLLDSMHYCLLLLAADDERFAAGRVWVMSLRGGFRNRSVETESMQSFQATG